MKFKNSNLNLYINQLRNQDSLNIKKKFKRIKYKFKKKINKFRFREYNYLSRLHKKLSFYKRYN